MTRKPDKYAEFVEHPRYGRRPNYTGLDPSPFDSKVHLHWNAVSYREAAQRFQALTGKKWPYGEVDFGGPAKRIPGTAIAADLARQTGATVSVTHYFDIERVCRDCGRPFIFFAEEQKHWYEELGFSLDSDCVRCVPCRKRQQGIARKRQRYEDLFHVSHRSTEENLEMADCCLSLIETGVFGKRQTERVRRLLNAIPADRDESTDVQCRELLARVVAIETKDDAQHDSQETCS